MFGLILQVKKYFDDRQIGDGVVPRKLYKIVWWMTIKSLLNQLCVPNGQNPMGIQDGVN